MKNDAMRYHFNQKPKEPELATRLKNEQLFTKEEVLKKEMKNVLRGLCYEGYCHIGKGGDVWNPEAYAFLNYRQDKAQAGTIAPELRELAKMYRINGLFEVIPGKIYQIRGYDSTNLTLVRTTESKQDQYGWVVINCLQSRECTYEALKLADAYFMQQNEEEKKAYCLSGNIKAIFLTEPEEACYGGTRAVLYYNQGCKSKAEEANYSLKEDVTIVTGENWLLECRKDLVYGGNVKQRKDRMANGVLLEAAENGKVMAGLGQGASAGAKGCMKPSSVLRRSCEYFVRGLRLQIQMSKALPGAYHLYFPDYKALWMSHWELPMYQLNGTYRPEWENIWEYYMEAYDLFSDTQVLLHTNGWPRWEEEGETENPGESHLQSYIKKRASFFKSLHDQAILYANMGYTVEEAANKVVLPKELEEEYLLNGTKEECMMYVKAVYYKHFGWYDGNPIHFAKLERTKQASNLSKYFREDFLETALKEYEKGNYQEVAEVLEMALLADPANERVRYLLSDCLEQLGYQATYGALRNAYLSSACEIRNPSVTGKLAAEGDNREQACLLTPEMFLEQLSIAYHRPAEEKSPAFDFYAKFNLEETSYYRITVVNGCILYKQEELEPILHVFELNRKQMYQILMNVGDFKKLKKVLPATKNRELNRNISEVFRQMVNVKEYRGYMLMEENLRGTVIACKNLLLSYLDEVKKADRKICFQLNDQDMENWQKQFYPKLTEGKYTGFDNMVGIPKSGVFHKYEYFLFLYQCFRYLARCCKDTIENRKVIECIRILEPYLQRFDEEAYDSERTIFLNVFDFHTVLETIQSLNSLEITFRNDGKITACELVEFLTEAYRLLYNN